MPEALFHEYAAREVCLQLTNLLSGKVENLYLPKGPHLIGHIFKRPFEPGTVLMTDKIYSEIYVRPGIQPPMDALTSVASNLADWCEPTKTVSFGILGMPQEGTRLANGLDVSIATDKETGISVRCIVRRNIELSKASLSLANWSEVTTQYVDHYCFDVLCGTPEGTTFLRAEVVPHA